MLLVIDTVPSVMSWVPVVIHSWVELLASGWGAIRHLPLFICAPGFEVNVIDSPGLSHVLTGGACSEIRLHATSGFFAWSLLCEAEIALDLTTSLPVL